MLPRHQPDRIRIAFDDHRLVANAGLILPFESTDQAEGMMPVSERVRPEPRWPGIHHRSLRNLVHSTSSILIFRSPSVLRMSFTYFLAHHEMARRKRSIRRSAKPARELCETSS